MKTRSAVGMASAATVFAATALASAGDWPAWRGPRRDGSKRPVRSPRRLPSRNHAAVPAPAPGARREPAIDSAGRATGT